MRHPSESTLALYAGGDLGPFARWRTDRHLAGCDSCREDVAAFAGLRDALPALGDIPDALWDPLAPEMKANIRLGLAAGECVRSSDAPRRHSLFSGVRAAVAVASIAAVLITAMVLEHPFPRQQPGPRRAPESVILQTTRDGIEVGDGGQGLKLKHAGAQNVMYSVGAQGSMRARYVDPETGNVTINNVYVE